MNVIVQRSNEILLLEEIGLWPGLACSSKKLPARDVCVSLHHKYIFGGTSREITLLCAFDHLSTS
jgi:hypothetical protein